MIFFTNLQKPTFDYYASIGGAPQGWLLSSHRATPAESHRARAVRIDGADLLADNGTIEHIAVALATFETRAGAIGREFSAFRRTLPRGRKDPAASAIPAEIRESAAAVAAEINELVDATFAAIPASDQTDRQLAVDPTRMICKEDWSIAVALGLGLERPITGWSIGRYVTRNRQSLRGWAEVRDAVGASRVLYVTLAAPDYPTARAVGREAARWGAENVALGFAGLNSTAGYTETTRRPHRRRLTVAGPLRYVRLAEIVTGFRDGYRDAGGRLQRFHALGLGARPMWPILAAGLDWWTDVSVDATSAIKDAEGPRPVLYDPDDLTGRVPVEEVAAHYLAHGTLPFRSPVLAAQLALPHDPEAARAWLAGRAAITHDDLRSGQPLARALPMFAHGTGSSAAGRMLAHHNYWASDESAARIPARRRARWATDTLRSLGEDPKVSVTIRNGARAALEVLEAS
jgi:hypothetical protein